MEQVAHETANVVRQIKRMLAEDLGLQVAADELPDDYSLLESGLALDSILIAELLALIEDRFAVQFDDLALEAAMLDNVSALAAFVVRARAAHRESRPMGE